MPKQALILDCDGVLYPISQISLAEFVDAMKQTYREELKIDGKTQALISEQTIAQNRLGMFNYIKAMCDYADYNFDEFCLKMQSRVDYDKITPDYGLYKQLLNTAFCRSDAFYDIIAYCRYFIQHRRNAVFKRIVSFRRSYIA